MREAGRLRLMISAGEARSGAGQIDRPRGFEERVIVEREGAFDAGAAACGRAAAWPAMLSPAPNG